MLWSKPFALEPPAHVREQLKLIGHHVAPVTLGFQIRPKACGVTNKRSAHADPRWTGHICRPSGVDERGSLTQSNHLDYVEPIPPPLVLSCATSIHPRSPHNVRKRWRESYPGAVRCLLDDRDSLTVDLRFPREHWTRVRHSNLSVRSVRHAAESRSSVGYLLSTPA
jgi:hypothetical protein